MILAGVIYKIYYDFSGAIYILVPRVLRTLGTNKRLGSRQATKFSIIMILAGMIWQFYFLSVETSENFNKRYYSESGGFSSDYYDFSGEIISNISPLKS